MGTAMVAPNGQEPVDENDDEQTDWSDDLDTARDQFEPLDLTAEDRKLVTQPYDLGVKSISDDIGSGRLQLGVQYQRKFVWDSAKSSRLIESLLLNVPIPVCYFAENEDGSYEVIDGLQRLTVINRFLLGEFPLSGISVLKELEGKYFSDLAPRDQRRLQNRTSRCIVISEDSHPDIKFDVFERLNTGAASLKAQELRNCIYRGEMNDALKKMAKLPDFLELLGSYNNSRMDHEELVLRYLALVEEVQAYRPPLRQFLNQYMRKNRRNPPSKALQDGFARTCEAVMKTLGEGAFRALVSDGRQSRNVNKALFDSIMIPISFCDQDSLAHAANEVKDLRLRLLRDPEFVAAIGRATADRLRMSFRIKKFADGLREVGVSVDLPPLAS
jgi:hypothetical protein